MKKNLSLQVAALSVGLLFVQSLIPLASDAGVQAQREDSQEPVGVARLSADVTINIAGRGRPWMALGDGRALVTSYVGTESGARMLRQDQARPLSLASYGSVEAADGLVCGYESPTGGGMVAVHRIAKDRVHRLTDAVRFEAPAQVVELPEPAEFIATGDFDADSRIDLVAASSGGEALYLVRGIERGAIGSPERIELPAKVTALVAGEINRADGLADLVVGVTGDEGPKALVFEGPKGALRQEPEVIELPADAVSLAIGQLDDSYEYDLAVAAGTELLIVHGRDRELWRSGNPDQLDQLEDLNGGPAVAEIQFEARPPVISRESFPFNLAAIAIGDFSTGLNHRSELAVLSEDGRLRYCEHDGSSAWSVITEVMMPAAAASGSQSLLKAKVSSLATDDLLVTDRASQHMRVVSGGPGSKRMLHEIVSVGLGRDARAALPVRLSGHALSDLVVLSAGSSEPSISLVTPQATFTVTNTNDSGPGSLRQAVLDANTSPGLDTITFNISAGAQGSIRPMVQDPEIVVIANILITDPVDIPLVLANFNRRPVISLDGRTAGPGTNGLSITAGNSRIEGLAIGNFPGHAISLQGQGGNMIKNNFLGTDSSGMENRGNGGEGVNIQNSNGNVVSYNNIVFNGDGGSVINAIENFIRDNNLGTDATMTQNKGNLGAGFGWANALNTRFEFNRSAFNRVGFFGFGGMGTIVKGNKVTNNTEDGLSASNTMDPTIGGKMRMEFNIFGGNGRHGVNLMSTTNALIISSYFGTDPTDANLPNGGAGVNLDGAGMRAQIGSSDIEARNTFGSNTSGIIAGAFVKEKFWIFNYFSDSGTLPIDVGRNGPDRNDFRDLDQLSGGSVNWPELSSAVSSQTDTMILGRLNSTPNRQFTLQYYLDDVVHPSGRGEGFPLGASSVTTDSNGDASINVRFSAPLRAGSSISAISFDLTTGEMSEFGNGVILTGGSGLPDLEVKKTGPETAKCREMVTYTITVRNVGNAAALGLRVFDTLPGCVQDEVEVIKPAGTSSSDFPNGVTTYIPRLDPGAPPITITIKATLSEDCKEMIVNLVSVSAVGGDINFSNNSDQVFTKVECTKIIGISIEGKHVVVSGLEFQKGDQIEINVILANTKFRDTDELLAKKGKKLLLPCDPANPARMNTIRLIRPGAPGSTFIDTAAFATCP